MAKRSITPGSVSPWTEGTKQELKARPGVTFIYLLTDEVGAAMLANGEVPEYLIQQAVDALEWCGTEERGIVKPLDKPKDAA